MLVTTIVMVAPTNDENDDLMIFIASYVAHPNTTPAAINTETLKIIQESATALKVTNAEAVAEHRTRLLKDATEALEQNFTPAKSDSTPGYGYVTPQNMATHTKSVEELSSKYIQEGAGYLESGDLAEVVSSLIATHRGRIHDYLHCSLDQAHSKCKELDSTKPPNKATLSTALEAVIAPARESYPEIDLTSHENKVKALISENIKAIKKYLGESVTVFMESLRLSSVSTLKALENEIDGLSVDDLFDPYPDAQAGLVQNLTAEINAAKEEAKSNLENKIKVGFEFLVMLVHESNISLVLVEWASQRSSFLIMVPKNTKKCFPHPSRTHSILRLDMS